MTRGWTLWRVRGGEEVREYAIYKEDQLRRDYHKTLGSAGFSARRIGNGVPREEYDRVIRTDRDGLIALRLQGIQIVNDQLAVVKLAGCAMTN